MKQVKSGWPAKIFLLGSFFLGQVSGAEAGDLSATLSTSAGIIEIKLLPEAAPKTVSNFVTLAQKGFFDGLIFHRIVPGVLIQTGDPRGNGSGGPGYCFADEFTSGLKHSKAGLVSMANTGAATNGSQFFVTLAAAPHLDQRHTIFAEVTKGMEVVTKIAQSELVGVKPVVDIKINKISIAGEFKPVAFTKQRQLSDSELKTKLQTPVRQLLTGVAETLNLGALGDLKFRYVHSKCAESQVAFDASFAKASAAKLLLFGRVHGDDELVIEQFQFTRGR